MDVLWEHAGINQGTDAPLIRELLSIRELLVLVITISKDKVVTDDVVAFKARTIVIRTTGRVTTTACGGYTSATVVSTPATNRYHLNNIKGVSQDQCIIIIITGQAQ